MGSNSLRTLSDGVKEVRNLQSANPILPGKLPDRPRVVRAVNRASVVLLCSYLERYLRSINEEAAGIVNGSEMSGAELPPVLRLQHSRYLIEELSVMQWDNRSRKLEEFLDSDGWLWSPNLTGELDHTLLLRWMSSPFPDRIERFFTLWGVPKVFSKITRRHHTRSRMWLRTQELVEKRNAIAHGDLDAEATRNDIGSYISVVNDLCRRTDGVLSRRLAMLCNRAAPW